MDARHPQAVGARTIAFVDGQNLFYAAKDAFGYEYPNYDVLKLARRVCYDKGWVLTETRFYTGVPAAEDSPFWSHFWQAKLAQMGRLNVVVYSRPLKYRNAVVKLPDGRAGTQLLGQEKGIDIRIALEMVCAAYEGRCDALLVFSQDQDLTEAVAEVRWVARQARREVRIACAFPDSPTSRNSRGIDKTDWIRIDRATYDDCIDTRDYRPKK